MHHVPGVSNPAKFHGKGTEIINLVRQQYILESTGNKWLAKQLIGE
jgi:hypothetical protein